jgi:hypothetical protein
MKKKKHLLHELFFRTVRSKINQEVVEVSIKMIGNE